MDCFCGYRLVEVICIEQMLSVKQTKFASTFISLAAHSLNIHRGSGLGPRAFYPSLLWQQLSVCCPDLLFARGMVAICWRRLNLSVPVFRTDRYADVRACMCVCVYVCFFTFSSIHMFTQAASISSLIGSENRKWHMCLSEGASGLESGLAHFSTHSREEQAAVWLPHGWCVGGRGQWEEEFEK